LRHSGNVYNDEKDVDKDGHPGNCIQNRRYPRKKGEVPPTILLSTMWTFGVIFEKWLYLIQSKAIKTIN
jgi:hypothetical protein